MVSVVTIYTVEYLQYGPLTSRPVLKKYVKKRSFKKIVLNNLFVSEILGCFKNVYRC